VVISASFKKSIDSFLHWLACLPCQSVNGLHLLLCDLHLVLVSRASSFLISSELSGVNISSFILGVGLEASIPWPPFTSNIEGLELDRESSLLFDPMVFHMLKFNSFSHCHDSYTGSDVSTPLENHQDMHGSFSVLLWSFQTGVAPYMFCSM